MANKDVSTTAVEILSSAKTTPYRTGFWIHNTHATETLYIGFDNTVTTSNGMDILAGDDFFVDPEVVDANLLWRGAIWGICASGPIDVRYLEFFKI